MAKIGLNNFRFSVLTEAADGTPSYAGAQKPAKAISCNVSITNNSAKLYADDVLAESDTGFQSGTVTIGLDDDNLEMQATMLGHVYSGGQIIRNANDLAPYVGLGRVVVKMINNARKYKVEFLHKVKFSEPSQEESTKGENLEFATGTMEGQVAALANGDWSKAKVFDSQADAITYLEALLAENTYTVTYDANGGTGSVDSVLVAAGSSITLNNGAGLTKSGKVFAGWATTDSAATADTTSPYTPAASVTLYAVWATPAAG